MNLMEIGVIEGPTHVGEIYTFQIHGFSHVLSTRPHTTIRNGFISRIAQKTCFCVRMYFLGIQSFEINSGLNLPNAAPVQKLHPNESVQKLCDCIEFTNCCNKSVIGIWIALSDLTVYFLLKRHLMEKC